MSEAQRSIPQDETLVRQRRRQIFQAACRVLARKSFHEASVKEFALEAGIAAGSIYIYLDGKDDILVLIAESMVGELAEALPAIRERGAGDPRRELIEVMHAILEVIDRYREAFNVIHHEARYLARRARYRAAMDKIAAHYRSIVADVLERGRVAGVIHTDSPASSVHAIHMLCAGWATGPGPRNIDREIYWREIARIVEGRFMVPRDTESNGRYEAPAKVRIEES